MRFLWIIFLLLCSCFGTFRTAKAVKEKKLSFDINWMLVEDENNTYNYFDSPCIIIRKGLRKGEDTGCKIFILGAELLFFKQFLFEEKHSYLPSAGFQAGFGLIYPFMPIMEAGLIFSKQFSFLIPYIALKGVYIPMGEGGGISTYGINGGCELTYFNKIQDGESKISFLLECFYGRISRFGLEGTTRYFGFALGAGLKFEK